MICPKNRPCIRLAETPCISDVWKISFLWGGVFLMIVTPKWILKGSRNNLSVCWKITVLSGQPAKTISKAGGSCIVEIHSREDTSDWLPVLPFVPLSTSWNSGVLVYVLQVAAVVYNWSHWAPSRASLPSITWAIWNVGRPTISLAATGCAMWEKATGLHERVGAFSVSPPPSRRSSAGSKYWEFVGETIKLS